MSSAFIFYFCVILLATGFAYLSTKIKFRWKKPLPTLTESSNKKPDIIFASLSFLSLFCLAAFSTSGVDYQRYIVWFHDSATFPISSVLTSPDAGYRLFNRIVSYLTSDFTDFVIIYSAVLLYLAYSTFIRYSDNISFPWAVFMYGLLFYLPMYSAKRSTLAAMMILYSIRYLLDKQHLKYALAIIVAATVHTSAILWSLFLFSYIIIKDNFFKKHKFLVILLYITIAVTLILTRDYWILLNISERYSNYEDEYHGLGIGIIIRYGFLLFLFLRWKNKKCDDSSVNDIWRICFLATCVSFVFAVSGYVNEVFTRMNIYSSYAYVIFIPFLIKWWKNSCSQNTSSSLEVNITKVALIIYAMFLYIDFARINVDEDSLKTYRTTWGLKI